MESAELFVGIDVSKDRLDVRGRSAADVRAAAAALQVANDPAGIARLVGVLAGLQPTLAVVEATGGLEAPLVVALWTAGVPIAVVNPRQVRQFAEGTGRHAKTDAIDAEVLAHFAETVKPAVRPPASDEQQAFAALLTRRGQLIEMRTMETNRLTAETDRRTRKSLEQHIRWLEHRIADVDRELGEAVRNSPVWREKDELLQSVPGVGPQTSRVVLGALPELGTLEPGQPAALVGLAPYNDDSGRHQGARHIRGGRADVRSALYMAGFNAVLHNEVFQAFRARLEAGGKAFKVIVTAAARKLVEIMNVMLRTKTPWQPELAMPR